MGILCIPLSMVWWTYHNNNNKYKQALFNWQSFQITSTDSVRPLSATKTLNKNRYYCLRSAALMVDTNGHTAADNNNNGIDMIAMKTRCIRSIGYIVKPLIEDNYLFSGDGTGVFVDGGGGGGGNDGLLLTCYHVVRNSPVVWVRYVGSYENQTVITCPITMADVLYVEPHWDLAIVRLRELLSPDYNTWTTMPMTTSTSGSIDFGAQVAMIGNGNKIMFALHPGMITIRRVDNNLTPALYYVSQVPFGQVLPLVANDGINVPGFSGCPLIDTDGLLCGIVWGGIQIWYSTYAIDYITLKEFINRALTYESDGIKHNRLMKRYEWDIRADTRLLGLIFSTKPFSGSFTVRSVLPTVSDETKSIIGSRVTKVFEHVFNNIDVIRSAIGSNRVIKLSIGLPIDDSSSSSSGSRGTVRDDSVSTVNINTIAPVDNHGFSIKPLVF
ncbi:uncharacterized protein LOC128955023 [Oppia nitens]|uniref:uncharacterized protein LOC128955023 n=1 Tax=Oppia nitens TaxID=1686743 RepID=UPI0023D9B92B|nr:uncharacterized protein LOC128955023 [Oppia nitens]